MTAAGKSSIALRGINKRFGKFQASKDISLNIEGGRLVALLGPSGSGKTTILRMIAGLEHPDSGEIRINDQVVNDVPGSERGIGFVFQNYALFRYMTVYDNIAFGLKVKKVPKKETQERVHELLKLIDCEGLEKRYPGQLSGGQKQRVAFARSLAPRPQILLLDEPFAAIDAKIRLELRSWLREMINELGITTIFVTHDQDEAIEVADDIIVNNEGRIEQSGTAEDLYSNPKTPFVARFIGNSVTVTNYDRFRAFRHVKKGGEGIIRPEFVEIYKMSEDIRYTESAEQGRVKDLIYRGSSIEAKVEIHGNILSSVRSINDPPLSVGEPVRVFVYRMFLVNGDRVDLVENPSLRENSMVV